MRFWTTIALILVLSATGLTYEIAAGRVLAPFFGTSLVTWTAVIATVLAGFSLGSALGGIVAERERRVAFRSVRAALIGTAALAALSPTLLAVIYAIGARGTGGMLLSVFIAFFPTSVLVSLPSPFLAKLAVEARPGREGSSLGLVLAAGSLGAIFGAVGAGFVALPFFGSAATFAGCGALALISALFVRDSGADARPIDADGGETSQKAATVLSFAAAALVVAAGMTGGKACQYESGLSCIDVVERGNAVYLYSDRTIQAGERPGAVESGTSGDAALLLSYTQWLWSRMDRDLSETASMLFIGGGGYTLPTMLLESRPEAEAMAVEIDPLITEVAREHLPWAGAKIARAGYGAEIGDPTADGRLGIVHADGRVFLNETDRHFDAAVVDAFSSGSVPAHLATVETYARLKEIVDGPVYVNMLDSPDGPLVRGVHAILTKLYPNIEVVQSAVNDQGRANVLIAASDAALAPLDQLPSGYGTIDVAPARAFTDDRGWVGHR